MLSRVRTTVLLAFLVILGVVVSTMENAIPTPLPWVRLGLSNVATVLALLLFGFREALAVTLARVVLGSLVSGGLAGPSFYLSLSGSLASVTAMGLLLLPGFFSPVGLSAAGGFCHTLAQFLVLGLFLPPNTSLLALAAPFLLLSLPAGALVGWLAMKADQALTDGRFHWLGNRRGGSVSLPPIVLASASPRRSWLISLMGLGFEVMATDVDERCLPGEPPEFHVVRLAREKALAALANRPGTTILAADTAVVIGDRILGKPAEREEARSMLEALQGRTHAVITGYAVIDPAGRIRDGCETTRVTMKQLGAEAIEAYLDQDESADKAGAYAAQGAGAAIIQRIEGSYTNVVGLPVEPLVAILRDLGYPAANPQLDRPTGSAGAPFPEKDIDNKKEQQ